MGVWAEHTWPALGVERASSELLGSGSQVSGVAIAAGNGHFVGSWVPIDQHPVSGAEGYGPHVRNWGRVEQGTTYSALSVGTVWKPANLAVAERPRRWGQGLYPFA